MSSVTLPLKTHGGKHYLAERIVGLMPPRFSNANPGGWLHYCEPYFGGGAVLLANDPEGISECVNDLDKDLHNFWSVLQSGALFESFRRAAEAMPFSELFWDISCGEHDPCPERPCVECAVWFFVRCRQSLAGRMKAFAPLSKTRTRRGMNEQCSAWLSAVEGLPLVHARMARVAILGPKDALEVIRQQDGPQTLFYCDPTYLHETRSQHRKNGQVSDYAHEMTTEQHADLLTVLGGARAAWALAATVQVAGTWRADARPITGKFLLSGYESAMYESAAEACGWRCETFDLPNNAAGGRGKRRMTECVWTNF